MFVKREFLGEAILLGIGLLTFVLGFWFGKGATTQETITLSIAFSILTVSTWTASATIFFLKPQLKKLTETFFNNRQGYKVVTASHIYKTAKEEIEGAKHVKATFFNDRLWKLQPNERGYGEGDDKLSNPREQSELEEYFKRLETRIEKGELEYHWLIYINNSQKFFALVDRTKTAIQKNTRALRLGDISIKVLPHSAFVEGNNILHSSPTPQINLQICQLRNNKASVLITPLRNSNMHTTSIKFFNQYGSDDSNLAINGFSEWYDVVQGRCLPIVCDGKVYLDNLYKQGILNKLGEEIVTKEIDHLQDMIIERKFDYVR